MHKYSISICVYVCVYIYKYIYIYIKKDERHWEESVGIIFARPCVWGLVLFYFIVQENGHVKIVLEQVCWVIQIYLILEERSHRNVM